MVLLVWLFEIHLFPLHQMVGRIILLSFPFLYNLFSVFNFTIRFQVMYPENTVDFHTSNSFNYILSVCMYLYPLCALNLCSAEAEGPLNLELWVVVSHHVGTGNWICTFHESRTHFPLWIIFSQIKTKFPKFILLYLYF